MSLELCDIPTFLAFHPSEKQFCVGLINGNILLYEYSLNDELFDFVLKWSYEKSANKPIRSIVFIRHQNRLNVWTCDSSSKIRVFRAQEGTLKKLILNTHEYPISAMCTINDKFVCTGDEDGTVKLWDVETFACVQSVRFHGDFISDLKYISHKKNLLVASGDGSLAVYDFKKAPQQVLLHAQSESTDDEFLCFETLQDYKKIVCCDTSGTVCVFRWGFFGVPKERLPVHSESIDCCCKINDDTLVTGSSDGVLRTVNLSPLRWTPLETESLALDETNSPTQLRVSYDQTVVAVLAHDSVLRLLKASFFHSSDPKKSQVKDKRCASSNDDDSWKDSRKKKTTSSKNKSHHEDDDFFGEF